MPKFTRSIFLLLLLLSFESYSQSHKSIKGKILNSKTKEAISFASVALKSSENKIIKGVSSDFEGNFAFDKIQIGEYKLSISSIGFSSKDVDINLKDKDLKNLIIYIKEDAEQLEAVIVQSQKDMIEIKPGLKTFKVNDQIAGSGGSAVDVLKVMPSVNVNLDGKISVRGNGNVTVLINGRDAGMNGVDPSTILDRIPAETIESIELMTNPSAKYNPENSGGVINIKVKKSNKVGFNGRVYTNYAPKNRTNTGLEFNWRKDKLNIFTNYSYTNRHRNGKVDVEQVNKSPQGDTTSITFSENERNRFAHNIGLGAEYEFNEKNILSWSSTFRHKTGDKIDYDHIRTRSDDKLLDSLTIRNTDEENVDLNLSHNLSYRKVFDKPEHTLDLSVRYSSQEDEENQEIELNKKGNPSLPFVDTQARSNQKINRSNLVMRADYVLPLSDKMRIEAGGNVSLRKIKDDLEYDVLLGDELIRDEPRSGSFSYDENVYAFYLMYQAEFDKWGLDVGVRPEFLDMKIEGYEDRSYTSFYPSLGLSYKLTEDQSFQLSYSKRVNRPYYRSLNPIQRFYGPSFARSGNPELKPEYINSFELGHSFSLDKVSTSVALFYKETKDARDRVSYFNNGVQYSTDVNISGTKNYGLDVSLNITLFKWWNANLNGMVYVNDIDNSNLEGFIVKDNQGNDREISYKKQEKSISGNLKLNQNFSLPWDVKMQASTTYFAPEKDAQGEFNGFFGTDLGFRKELMDKKLKLSFNINDVFNTMRWAGSSDTPEFRSSFDYKPNSRFFQLGVSYSFGKQDKKKRRRNSNGGDFDGGGMG